MIFFFLFLHSSLVGYQGPNVCRALKYSPCFPLYCHVGKFGSSGRAREMSKGSLDFLSGTSRCQALVPLVPQSGGCPWRGSWAECALCWGLVLEDKWVLSGHPRPSPLAAPLLYHCHSCHSSPCHTWSRRWGIASMENRIATVEWPSHRGSWGASHTSDRFELYSMISLIYQMHIYINF